MSLKLNPLDKMENVTHMDNTNESMAINGAIYSTENPAFCGYLLCASLLIIKMMLTTILVVYHRIKNKVIYQYIFYAIGRKSAF